MTTGTKQKSYRIDDLEFDDDDLAKFKTVMALTTALQETLFRFAQKHGDQQISHVLLALVITICTGIEAMDDPNDKFEEVSDVIGMIRKLTGTVVQ